MPPDTPNTERKVFLSDVRYFPEKRVILVEYANGDYCFNERHSFFPYFHLPLKAVNEKAVLDLLSLYDSRRFLAEKEKQMMKVSAKTFVDLKKLANLIHSSLGFRPFLLGPERQYLIENKVSYFDCFEETRLGLERGEELLLPNISLDFTSDSLPGTLTQLLKNDTPTALKLLDSLIYSNILSVPVQEVPFKKSLVVELYLEKIFFMQGFAFKKDKVEGGIAWPKRRRPLFHCFDETVELDFSFVWPTLFTFPYHNLGFESLNCRCCRPESLEAENLSPASMVEVKFSSSAVYIFNSVAPQWAEDFHQKRKGKESRERLKTEFCLDMVPVGPFGEGQRELIPLSDARILLEEGKICIASQGCHQLNWFCQKKESFLSKEIDGLNQSIARQGRHLQKRETLALRDSGIFASQRLEQDLDYLFSRRFKEGLSELLTFIPAHLSSPKSKFYSAVLSKTIKALQVQTLKEFREFTSAQGSKFIHASNNQAFVKAENALSLARQFSAEQAVPTPKIKQMYSWA